MRKLFAALFVSSMVLSSSVAFAYDVPYFWEIKFNGVEERIEVPIAWDPSGLPVQIFTGLDDGIEDNWGVAQVTSIIDRATSTVVWSDGQNGEYLTLMFGGLDTYQITAIDTDLDMIPDSFNARLKGASWVDLNNNASQDPGEEVLDLTGDGIPDAFLSIDLYNSDDYDITGGPSARTGVYDYPTVTDGVQQALFAFAPGVRPLDGNAVTDVSSDAITSISTGDGTGYLEIIFGSGPLASILLPDTFVTAWGLRDVFLEFNFRPHPDQGLPDYGWALNTEDPAFGNAGVIPEPSTMVLLGAGLVGLAFVARRRKP